MKSDQLEGWYKSWFLDAIIQLSRKSGHFPQSLRLRQIDNLRPTSLHGGSASISQGELLGRLVAVKEIQAVGRTTEQFLKVSMVSVPKEISIISLPVGRLE
jgi:hypothetical protein